MAECPYKECVYHSDCEIIEITKKVPKSKEKCSYFCRETIKKKEKGSSKKPDKENSDV